MALRTETPEIYTDLERKLMTATFPPGQRLKPGALQAEYGCSPNTVRDVLLRLSKVGLVDFELQRGFRARAATPERRRDITRFRILLEQEGASRSMEHGGVVWEADIAAAHTRLGHIEREIARSTDVAAHVELWSDAELAFHETLISACGSAILKETYRNTYAQFRQQYVSLEQGSEVGHFGRIISEHQAILDAALARDASACRQAIYAHLERNLT
ncbi:MAG: GntR family transcriptional regulator [Pseudomonadota bacterium]